MPLPYLLAVTLLLASTAPIQQQQEPPKESKEVAEAKAKLLKHPLDPLTEDEIKSVRKILLDSKTATRYAVFSFITLVEPKKEDVLAFKAGDPIVRRAKTFYYETQTNDSVEAVINLETKTVESKVLSKKQG